MPPALRPCINVNRDLCLQNRVKTHFGAAFSPRPAFVANKSSNLLSSPLIFLRQRLHDLSSEPKIARVFRRMTNVTAETITRGYGGGAAAPSARLAAEASEERPSASQFCEYAFELELLRLSARGRRSSGLALAVLSALAGVVAARYAAWIWLVSDASAVGTAYLFAGKLLDADEGHCAIRRWRWIFVSAETLQGILWAVIVWLISEYGDPAARSFSIVLFLLVAAMNATISAAIPSAAP
jgi:hypothetical protein